MKKITKKSAEKVGKKVGRNFTKKTKGKFIVIEGGEGSGKTTLLKSLQKAEILPETVYFSREPGGSPNAEIIRALILSPEMGDASAKTMLSLFWASRAEHVEKLIRPTLERGHHIVVDRFDSSSYAYQLYGQNAPDLEELFFHIRQIFLGDTVPDLYIYLKVDPIVGLKRKKDQADEINHFDKRALDFHLRVGNGLEKFISQFPHAIIDANQTKEVVFAECLTIIKKLLD